MVDAEAYSASARAIRHEKLGRASREDRGMNAERLALFGAVYQVELERAVLAYPDEYVWPVEDVPTVASRMIDAIQRGSYNKDSRAIKATCKAFGINHTYKAISAWLAETS